MAEIEIPEVMGNDYMLIEFNYGKIIVPVEYGITILRSLSHAETLEERPDRITEFNRKTFSFTLMSREEYVDIKMKALIGAKEED